MNEDENRIIEALLSGDDPALDVIRSQIKQARVTYRRWTRTGLLTDFAIPEAAPRLDPANFYTVESLGRLGGRDGIFILFIRAGIVQMLEFAAWDGKIVEGGSLEKIVAPGHITLHNGH